MPPEVVLARLEQATADARTVLRETHEAMRDLSVMQRELASAQGNLKKNAEAAVKTALEPVETRVSRDFGMLIAGLSKALDDAKISIRDHVAGFAGLKTPEEFMTAVVEAVLSDLRRAAEMAAESEAISATEILSQQPLIVLARIRPEPKPGT